ncbi:hypothetical protein E2542_SST20212 [Spatholobus suberectus]|nr:hypothetical protein E2542_SST20212 [Spatholobus suberectus]
MDFPLGSEDPTIPQLHKWDSSEIHLEEENERLTKRKGIVDFMQEMVLIMQKVRPKVILGEEVDASELT